MGLLEDVARLAADVAGLKLALGSHQRVPETRWGVVTTCNTQTTRVAFLGEIGEVAITRSTETVWVGAQVLVQVQGSDRWIIGLSGATIPAGMVAYFGSTTPPPGWLTCVGQSLNRATYWRLFSAIGTTYGANDSASFNAPNLMGRIPVGLYVGNPGTDTMGKMGGDFTHTLTVNEMPSHAHTFPLGVQSWPYASSHTEHAAADWGTAKAPRVYNTAMDSAGGSQPHNNMQPYVIMQAIIKF